MPGLLPSVCPNHRMLLCRRRECCLSCSTSGSLQLQRQPDAVQAWLVPHAPEEAASLGCGFGAAPAVHSGFSTSWQSKLRTAVCALLQTVVNHNDKTAARMRVYVTGRTWLLHSPSMQHMPRPCAQTALLPQSMRCQHVPHLLWIRL